MLGRESPQRSLFGAHLSVEHLLPSGSFYDVLYREIDRLISDDDFAACYDLTTGRPSVPPSRMAKLLLLQTYEDLSDRQALERMTFDLRWKAILGMEIGEPSVAQATLAEFRARLQLHGKMRQIFDRFLALAVQAGLIDPTTVQAIDSTAIWGRGAVEDTYNLIGSAMRTVLRATARRRGQQTSELASVLGLVYADPADPRSLKGRAEIDWRDTAQRRAFLNCVVEEARRLLSATAEDQRVDPAVAEAAELLRRILVQDLEPVSSSLPKGGPPPEQRLLERGSAVELRLGTAADRIVSISDPEMRVGHKSEREYWEGYKAHVSVETAREFITGTAVSDATAYDGDLAPQLLEAQQRVGLEPAVLVGDQAYSKAAVRGEVAALGSELVARVPPAPTRRGCFGKDAFTVDLAARSVTCPAGVETRRSHPHARGELFLFPGATCAACPLRAHGTPRDPQEMRRRGFGRSVAVHPLEVVLQRARAVERTPRIQALLKQRVAAERRLAHLMRRGLRQARYRGRAKVEFQALATALVVNLRRLGTLFIGAPPLRAQWRAAI
jgi:transposase